MWLYGRPCGSRVRRSKLFKRDKELAPRSGPILRVCRTEGLPHEAFFKRKLPPEGSKSDKHRECRPPVAIYYSGAQKCHQYTGFRRRRVGCFSRRERRAHICIHMGRASNAEKQPTGHGPEGCDENGPAAVPRPRDRLRIDLDMRPPRVRQLPDRRPILIATKAMIFMGQDTDPSAYKCYPQHRCCSHAQRRPVKSPKGSFYIVRLGLLGDKAKRTLCRNSCVQPAGFNIPRVPSLHPDALFAMTLDNSSRKQDKGGRRQRS